MNILNKILGSLTNYEIVRSAVAKNPNTPISLLEKLSDDKIGGRENQWPITQIPQLIS